MNLHWTPFPLILLGIAGVVCALAVYSWRSRATPAGAPVVALLLSVATWVFLAGWEGLFPDLATKWLLTKLSYLGIVFVAPSALVVALHATGRAKWCTPRLLGLLAVVPVQGRAAWGEAVVVASPRLIE